MKIITIDELREMMKYEEKYTTTKVETLKEMLTETELFKKSDIHCNTHLIEPEELTFHVASLTTLRHVSDLLKKLAEGGFEMITLPKIWTRKEADVYFIKAWCYGVKEIKDVSESRG